MSAILRDVPLSRSLRRRFARDSKSSRGYTRDNALTYDQATLDSTGAFLIGELERLDQQLHMPLASVTWTRDIDLREDVTIADEVSSFTNSTFAAVGGMNPTGKNWISKVGNAIGRVNLDIGKTAHNLNLWGMELSYTIPELKSAMQTGRPIDSQKLAAINLKWNMDADQQVYQGDTDLNVTGLCNDPSVTATNVVNGGSGTAWSTKSAEQILADIRTLEESVWASSAYSFAPRKLLVPPSQFQLLLQPLTVGTAVVSESILSYIKRNCLSLVVNGAPLEIVPVKWLYNMGTGSTARMVAYTQEMDKVRFPIVPLMNTPIQYDSIYMKSTYFGRMGQVEIVYSTTIGYADGI
jgi:hypothetical protein